MRRGRRSLHAFTLLETLIVLAILGLLASIGIPMWMNAVNRAKQSATVASMRQIAAAWEARAADFKAYNAAGGTFTMPPTPLPEPNLELLLQPTYIRSIPQQDGWHHPLDFATDSVNGSNASVYAIRSPGRDGQLDGGPSTTTYTTGTTSRFDCDIVYSNGAFVVSPEGAQKN